MVMIIIIIIIIINAAIVLKSESGVIRVLAQNYDERLCKVFLLSSMVHLTHLHT